MPKKVEVPKPYNCRRPPPPTPVGESFDDELSKRIALHRSLDEAFQTTNPPSEPGAHIPPSWRLYAPLTARPSSAAAWATEVRAWRSRWRIATALDEKYALSVTAQLMLALELPLLCREPEASLARRLLRALSAAVGRAVHTTINQRYLLQYANDTVVCDGRIFFRDRSEDLLSRLASNDRETVYGALNLSLAGQRNDIINVDRGEMWEIKPANLTRRNLMQLWGYVDNYEVARLICHYDGRLVPPVMRPGDPQSLTQAILAPFPLQIGPTLITITPQVDPALPGLIGYTVARSEERSDEQAAIRAIQALGALRPVLESVRKRDSDERLRDMEEEARRLAVVCAVGQVLAVVAVVAVTGGLAVYVAGAVAAAGTGAVALGAGEAAIASAEIISLTAARAAAASAVEQMAVHTIRAAATQAATETVKVAAGMATIYVAGQSFSVPAEVAPMCIEAGCAAGSASVPASPR
jgi:hypothetical protein